MRSFSTFLRSATIIVLAANSIENRTIASHRPAAPGGCRTFRITDQIFRYMWLSLSKGCANSDRFLMGGTRMMVGTVAVVTGLVKTGLYTDSFYAYSTMRVVPLPGS